MFVKRFLGVCTAVVMLFSMTTSVYALDTSSDVPVEISEFADIVGLIGLSSPRPLYSPDEELFGYCAEGTNCYIIYDKKYNMVEYSDSKLSEYHDVTSTLYYGGPLAYYVKENGQFRHLQSGELYTSSDFLSNDEYERQIEAKASAVENEFDAGIQPMATVTENYTIPNSDFSYYDTAWYADGTYGGSCGQIAATGILAFLGAEGSINMPIYYLQNPYSLFLELIQTIPHGTEDYGTDVIDLTTGLNAYASKKKYSYSTSYVAFSTTSENNYRTRIRNGMPSIVGLTGHPLYKEHWVIGYGYKTVKGSRGDISKSVIVDDGWGNDNIVLSNIFVDFFVYFNV